MGQQRTAEGHRFDMSRYEPGQTICYPVRISQSYIYRLAGAPVRLKYAQISLQKIVKQRQLPVLCQKKTSGLIHYDTQLGSSTEPQLQGFGLEVLRPSPAQADPNLKTACSEFPACEESPSCQGSLQIKAPAMVPQHLAPMSMTHMTLWSKYQPPQANRI